MNTTHNDPAAPMNVLYKHDRVGPTLMVLDALIPLVAGHSATHAADMTDELLSRGWYENADDEGHYVVLNLDMLQLTPTPEGWDGIYHTRKTRQVNKPSCRHRDDGRGFCVDCEEAI